jgi:4-amino-4-deoxy-L-arabinose transferase-like glycosyltransferase
VKTSPAERERFSVSSLAYLALLAALTMLRLAVAATTPVVPDEAYYWVWSHALAPGYLDHPPMVALWIRAGTALAGEGPLGVRLLGSLAAALGTLLLADAAERLLPARRAGLTAAALWNATLLCGAGAVIMTPDTPLLFFWTAALWALARLVTGGRAAWWLAVGVFAGLALASKYTAALLWLGIGLWLLWVPSLRHWWRSPALWAGVGLGLLAFLPVVLWNAAHHWASFLRQGGRVGDWQPWRAAQFLAELIGGQLGLATPLLFLVFCAGVARAARRAWRMRDPAWSLLAALTLPGAAAFLQHALGDRVQGNWPAILYPAATIAACGLAAPRWRRLFLPGIALGLAITALVYVDAAAAMLPPGIDPLARQLAGWQALARSVEAGREAAGATFVAAESYGVAGELARDMPPGVDVVGVEPRCALTRLPQAALAGTTGILVLHEGNGAPGGWAQASLIGPAARVRGGVVIEPFQLWRVVGPAGASYAAMLPRPDGAK